MNPQSQIDHHTEALQPVKHVISTGEGSRVFVLFHGSGADEHDLIPLAKELDSRATILSLRGGVDEQGMLRFFRRSAPGVFDQESIRTQAARVSRFLQTTISARGWKPENMVYLGFSNGASMIAALMQLHPRFIHTAILLHGLQALSAVPAANLDCKVFLSAGLTDTLVSPMQTQDLLRSLEQNGAGVTHYLTQAGHTITADELDAIKKFLAVLS